ncbi:MAG: hypothetical protein JNL83_31885 [Myxococcales bacterium]|nr:hypothetical protein [Myxococcales bacterium]
MGAWRRLLAVVVLSSGCSLALSGPDPKRAPSDPPACDTGKGLVGLDGVVGGGLAIATLAFAANDEGAAALVSGLFATAFIGAAIRGNGEVNECREAMATYGARDVDRAIDEPRVATKPAAPSPRRAPQPPSVMQPEQPGDPYGDEPPYQAPHVNPAVAPPPVTAPAPASPPAPATRPTATPPPAPPLQAEEPQDWKDFWTEVP